MLCLVTDRRRRSPVKQAGEAAAAGVDLIQVRERDLEAGALSALVDGIVRATRGSGTKVVVNDRLDVAMACGADGVHLRGDSMPAARVRDMAPAGFLIGCSVRGAGEARAAALHADYLIAGTVFPTSSKPGLADFLGLEGLAAIAKAVPVPVLAIGGVTDVHAREIAATGAAGLAAISLFADENRPILDVVREMRAYFPQR